MLHAELIEKDLKKWNPLPGPQTEAFYSKADVLFFGGSAGGGKTDLLLGLSHRAHENSIIFRREKEQLKGLERRAEKIFCKKNEKLADYNRTTKVFRFFDGRILELAGVETEDDKENFQGRDHDLKGFDELTSFTRSQFTYIIGWTRSTTPGQRSRVVCTGNPPTTTEGRWVIEYFAPWLDKRHKNKAAYGELRWFTTLDGREVEVKNGDPFWHRNKDTGKDELITPLSRTFIKSTVEDNPYLNNTNYKARLQALRPELRSKMLYGNFDEDQEDNPWQVIPTEWIKAAQERWKVTPKPNIAMSALGIDVARGGNDRTIMTPRYANWFGAQHCYKGTETPNGDSVAQLAMKHVEKGAIIQIDVIGIGSSPYDAILKIWPETIPLCSAENNKIDMYGQRETDKTGKQFFLNNRAKWWWKLSEALDPASGMQICIPDDPELLEELAIVKYKLNANVIQIQKKEDIIDDLGRSPDKADSLIYAFAQEQIPQARATIF